MITDYSSPNCYEVHEYVYVNHFFRASCAPIAWYKLKGNCSLPEICQKSLLVGHLSMLYQFQMLFDNEQDVIRIVCGNCKVMGWKRLCFSRSYIAPNVTSHESSSQNKLQGLEPYTSRI